MVYLSVVKLLTLVSCFCGGMYQHTQKIQFCALAIWSGLKQAFKCLCMQSESIGLAWAQCFNAFKAGMFITRRERDYNALASQQLWFNIVEDKGPVWKKSRAAFYRQRLPHG